MMYDRWGKKKIARIIKEKGVHDYAVDRIVLKSATWGTKETF